MSIKACRVVVFLLLCITILAGCGGPPRGAFRQAEDDLQSDCRREGHVCKDFKLKEHVSWDILPGDKAHDLRRWGCFEIRYSRSQTGGRRWFDACATFTYTEIGSDAVQVGAASIRDAGCDMLRVPCSEWPTIRLPWEPTPTPDPGWSG